MIDRTHWLKFTLRLFWINLNKNRRQIKKVVSLKKRIKIKKDNKKVVLPFTKFVSDHSVSYILGMKVQFYVDISRMTGCIFGVFAFEILDNWIGPGKKKSCSQRIVFWEFVKFGSFQVGALLQKWFKALWSSGFLKTHLTFSFDVKWSLNSLSNYMSFSAVFL